MACEVDTGVDVSPAFAQWCLGLSRAIRDRTAFSILRSSSGQALQDELAAVHVAFGVRRRPRLIEEKAIINLSTYH